MREMLENGGVVMVVIVAASVVGFGFAIERLLAFWRQTGPLDHFFPELENHVRLGKLDDAIALCQAEKGLIPEIMRLGLQHQGDGLETVKQVLADEVQLTAIPRLEKHLDVIAVVIKTAPMLGLLGTVMGMIAMFQEISAKPSFEVNDLSHSIFLALGTTAAGLMVAIPLIFCHAYFTSRIGRFETECHRYLTRLVRLLARRRDVAGPGGAAAVQPKVADARAR